MERRIWYVLAAAIMKAGKAAIFGVVKGKIRGPLRFVTNNNGECVNFVANDGGNLRWVAYNKMEYDGFFRLVSGEGTNSINRTA